MLNKVGSCLFYFFKTLFLICKWIKDAFCHFKIKNLTDNELGNYKLGVYALAYLLENKIYS